MEAVTETTGSKPFLPPRWFIRAFWRGHRWLYRLSRGKFGLREAIPNSKAGMMQLRTIGRRSGQERAVIVAYVEDGENLVTLAMNGWGEADPAWWQNLQAHPDAEVVLVGGSRKVRAHEATGEERERLWPDLSGWGDIDRFSALRERSRPVVVLEPRGAGGLPS